MDWSKDMGLSLVNLYKNKEVLWNPGNSEYHQKNRRHDAWQEVADELSLIIKKPVSSLECKRKMDTILSSFRRERVKVRKISEMAEGGMLDEFNHWRNWHSRDCRYGNWVLCDSSPCSICFLTNFLDAVG